MISRLLAQKGWLTPRVAGRLSALQIAWRNTTYDKSHWRSLFSALFQQKKKNLIIIVSTKRSGTNLLCNIFYQYPDMFSNYEILNVGEHKYAAAIRSNSDLVEYLQMAGSATSDNFVVSKIFHEHMAERGLSWFAASKLLVDCKILHLVRTDLLAQYASLLSAKQSNEWAAQTENSLGSKQSVQVDLSEFKKYADERIRNDATVVKAFENHPGYYRFSYEELSKDPVKYVACELAPKLGVSTFTGVEQWTVKPAVGLEQRISNWEEIQDRIEAAERYNPYGEKYES